MLMFLKASVSLTIECNRSTEVHRDRTILNTCAVCFSCGVFINVLNMVPKNLKGNLISQIFFVVSIEYISILKAFPSG